MHLRSTECGWMALAPAKLNLYLKVLGDRQDGFHDLETLIVPLAWYDTVYFDPVPAAADAQLTLSIEDCRDRYSWAGDVDPLPAGEKNLVMRCLRLLQRQANVTRGGHVRLVKRIPTAAGLGGGSSDAAAALALANRAWKLGWSRSKLAGLGAEVGSDIPFFLSRGPAICRGRGEQVEPVEGCTPLYSVVVAPPVALATGQVFAALPGTSCAGGRDDRWMQIVDDLRIGRVTNLATYMNNCLQAAAATLSPWVERLRSAFAQVEVVAHQLTGSGSAYFGICRTARHARRVAGYLRTQQLGVVVAASSTT